jgi:DNA-directed RNA polymerase subunit RPC12/RpoP
MLGEVDRWRERQLRAELVYNLCGRAAATVQGPCAQRFVPTRLVVKAPEHASAVRRLRCPHCGGRLLLQNQEEIQVYRGPVPDEDEPPAPRRGRPRRTSWL